MHRRALLFGCPTFGLHGCLQDVVLMKECLEDYDFECQTLTGVEATRTEMLAAYRNFIEQTQHGDAVVIYFSGHGGRVHHPDPQTVGTLATQFLVPSDFSQDPAAPFLGITDWELSHLLGLLTKKTQNTSIILDCCHAGSMSRNNFTARNLPPQQRNLRRHLEKVAEAYGTDSLPTESNPAAVRLAATRPECQAFEYPSLDYGAVGLFTETLTELLKSFKGKEITWERLFRQVREWVLGQEPRQRPCLEGPSQRVVFETRILVSHQGPTFFYHQPDPTSSVMLPALRGGFLADIREGDVYELAAQVPRAARVIEAHPDLALVDLQGEGWIQPGTPATLRERAHSGLPIHVDASAAELLPFIAREPCLKAWHPRDPIPAIARVSKGSGKFQVCDRHGQLLRYPTAQATEAHQALVQCGKAQTLLTLAQKLETQHSDLRLCETWGCIQEGQAVPLPEDHRFRDGDRFYLELLNSGQQEIWVNVINIGVGRSICLLNQATLTTGIHMLPGQRHCLGHSPYKGLVGLKVSWPTTVPPAGSHSEWVIVAGSSMPLDFSPLQGHGETRSWTHQALLNLTGQGSHRAEDQIAPMIQLRLKHFQWDLEHFKFNQQQYPALVM